MPARSRSGRPSRGLQQGALPDPPHADRGRRPRGRPARAVRRHRRLRGRGRRGDARSVPARRRRLAAGPGAARSAGDREAPGRSRGLRAEGWKWIAVATDFPYGHTAGLRRLAGETTELTEEEAATFDALQAEYERWRRSTPRPTTCPRRSISASPRSRRRIAAFENRPVRFDPADIARAGIFVSIDSDGALRVERGFVRPEDEAPVEPIPTGGGRTAPEPTSAEIPVQRAVITIGGAPTAPETEAPEEDDDHPPLSDRLMTELTAHRTLALREGVANDPQVAFRAVLHALCLNAFYRSAASTCLEITAKQSGFSAQAPGLAETLPRRPSTRATRNG